MGRLGDGSLSNVFVTQCEDLRSDPQRPCKKSGMGACTCNPNAGEIMTGGSLDITGQTVYSQIRELQVEQETLSQTTKSTTEEHTQG